MISVTEPHQIHAFALRLIDLFIGALDVELPHSSTRCPTRDLDILVVNTSQLTSLTKLCLAHGYAGSLARHDRQDTE